MAVRAKSKAQRPAKQLSLFEAAAADKRRRAAFDARVAVAEEVLMQSSLFQLSKAQNDFEFMAAVYTKAVKNLRQRRVFKEINQTATHLYIATSKSVTA